MGVRLGVVIGALVVAAALLAGYFLFWQEEAPREPQQAEAPASAPAAPSAEQPAPEPKAAEPTASGQKSSGQKPGEKPEAETVAAGQQSATPAAQPSESQPSDTGASETRQGEVTASQAQQSQAQQSQAQQSQAPQSGERQSQAGAPAAQSGAEPKAVGKAETAEATASPKPAEATAEPAPAAAPKSGLAEAEPKAAVPVQPATPPAAGQSESGKSRPAAPQVGDEQTARLPQQQKPEAETAPAKTLPARIVPSFDVVRVDRDGSAVIAGRAEPNSTVTLMRNGELLGKIKADAAGDWVFITDRPLPPGDHQLSLLARSPDGKEIEAPRVVVVSVPKPEVQVAEPAGAPKSAEPVEPSTVEPHGPVAVALDKSGEGDVVVLQGIDAGVAVGDLVLETLRYDAEGRVTVTGKVTAGGRVFAYIDDAFVGEAQGDDKGNWRLKPAAPVAMGLHRLRLDQVDKDGGVLSRLETPFARSSLLTDLPEGQRLVIVQPGNSLWRIAQRTLGEGLRYTLIFEANENQIRNPDLIYPGQVFVVPEDKGPPS